MWVTFLGNSSQWCYHWIFRDPTLTQTKHRRDYVDSPAGLYQYYSHPPAQTIIWHQARPTNPSQNTRAPSLPPPRTVWVHPAGMNCIIDHLLYIHTGIIMFTITLTGLNTHGDKLDIKSQSDDQSYPDGGKISQLHTRFSHHQPSLLLSDHLMEKGRITKVFTNVISKSRRNLPGQFILFTNFLWSDLSLWGHFLIVNSLWKRICSFYLCNCWLRSTTLPLEHGQLYCIIM